MRPLEGRRVACRAAADSCAALVHELLVELGASSISAAGAAASPPADIVLLDRGGLEGTCGDLASIRADAERPGGPVVAVISAFGLSGPLRDAPAAELILQSLTGVLAANGYADDPPVQVGVPVGRTGTSILTITAILAALVERGRSGRGQLVDMAEYDCMINFLGTLLPTYFLTGQPFRRIGNRHPMSAPWNAYPTADGWVVMSTMGEPQWRAVLTVTGRVDLAADPRFGNAELRVLNVVAVDEVVEAWTSRRRTDEVLRDLTAVGIPVAPVRNLLEALDNEQAVARGLVSTAGGVLRAGPLFRLRESSAAEPAPPGAPAGAHPAAPRSAPLSGIRVVEIGSFTAGPLAGRLLGQLGAEVIKVEPPQGEGSRHLAQRLGGTGYLYFVNNTDKYGVQLALDTPDGAAALRRLLAASDVFLTNLAADTLAGLGLDAASVAASNPRLVYTSITGYGLTGPAASRRAFDTVVQAASGVMSLTGFPSQPPLKAALSVADIFAACTAAAGTLAGLLCRERDGCGQIVDAAMFDAAIWISKSVWPATPGGPAPVRAGNRSPLFAPHDVYPCAEGGWLAIAVTDDVQWRALCGVLGGVVPDTLVGAAGRERRDQAAVIDELLRGWLACRTAARAAAELTAAGVPSAVPGTLADVAAHPQTTARALILTQADDMHGELHVIGSPFKFSATPIGVRRRAPHLGEHNAQYVPSDGNS